MSITRLVGILLLVTAAASCSTASFVKKEENILKVTDLIYQQKPESLAEITNRPFLFDSEILVREEDTDAMWENLSAAGLRLPEIEILEAETVTEDSWKAFVSESYYERDVKSFFGNYVSDEAAFVKIQSAQGLFLLILDGKSSGGYPMISAVRGPLDE